MSDRRADDTARSEGASERDLVARFRSGDSRAFDEIVTRYSPRVYAVALRMCGNAEDARDVAQDVFVSAMRSIRSFREDAQLSTWLHRIAVNASLDLLRKRARRPAQTLDVVENRPAPGPGPEEHAVAAARAVAVHAALQRLTAEHRTVLVLHDLQDLNYAEVAEALDVPVGTVKSRIHRARIEMARLLGHLREGHETDERLRQRHGEPPGPPQPLREGP